MNRAILDKRVQLFIKKHLYDDAISLILKGSPFEEVTIQELVSQIEAKRKCEKKLPTFFNMESLYYPSKLNIEQTSSEKTAQYKANLVEGESLIDITGGFGVDSLFFAQKVTAVTHCEISVELSAIAKYNFTLLNAENIATIATDGIEYLQSSANTYHWIYVDPSRRDAEKRRVFLLEDCQPTIPLHLDMLFTKAPNILIKVAPILDISKAINELKYVKEVHVVALENEVKELLFVLERGFKKPVMIHTVNVMKAGSQKFSYVFQESVMAIYSPVSHYLYEPNAAILKSGGMAHITSHYPVAKLHKHSHLYTSEQLVDFPGRTFIVKHCVPYQKKELRKLSITKANITTRNFPETVKELRKKWKIKEGGMLYLFFTTAVNHQKIVLICSKK